MLPAAPAVAEGIINTIGILTVWAAANSGDGELPNLGGTWEEELDYADNGPKDESTECNSDGDDYCKKFLQTLRAFQRDIMRLENLGANTTQAKLTFNALARLYHESCPYWVKVKPYFGGGAANSPRF